MVENIKLNAFVALVHLEFDVGSLAIDYLAQFWQL